MPEALDAGSLTAKLRGVRLARTIRVLEETTSTNDVAAEFGRSGETEGLLVFAEHQTKGRGRLGRAWQSPRGEALAFSLLLRPALAVALWPRLTTWAATAVAEAVEGFVPCGAAIKWPNDIYLNGRKAVGILTESAATPDGFAVVGIGVNVNQQEFAPPLDASATSLRIEAGAELDRQDVAAAIVRALDATYPLVETDFPEIVRRAGERNFLQGRQIALDYGFDRIRGVAGALDENGSLIVHREDGGLMIANSGEVMLSAW